MRGYIILLAFATSVLRTDSEITCDAPTVEKGSPANITCHFDTDIVQTRTLFGIDRYTDGNPRPQAVLRCHWPEENSTNPRCTHKEGYSYVLTDTRSLNLQISATTEEYAGNYACLEMASDETVEYCKLTLKQTVNDSVVTCDAPVVVRGSPANITCHFGTDIGRTRTPFGVDRYMAGHRQVVLRCHWPEGNRTVPKCTHKKGFSYNLAATRDLTIQISSITEDNVGPYVCQELGSDDYLEQCEITLKQAATGSKTTCDAPLAVLGETARVTCHFSSDVTANVPRPSFNVRRADHDNFDYHRDTVLDCDWVNADLLCMTIKDGYQFNKDVSDQLTVTIPNVTHEHSGQYVCQAVAVTQNNQIEPCRLTVTGTLPSPDEARTKVSISTTTEFPSSTTGRTHSAASVKEGSVDITVIVLPILGVALLVIVILAFLRNRKRSKQGNISKHDDGNDKEQDIEATPEFHEETPLMQQPSTGNTDSSLPEASEGFAATSNSTSPDHLQPERHEEIASTVSRPPPPVQPPTANTDSSLPEASAGNEATSNTPSPAFVQPQDPAETRNQETHQPSTATSYDDDEDEEAIKEKYDRVMLELQVQKKTNKLFKLQ